MNNLASGQVFDSVIKKERRGEYLGKTVQFIPHVTDEIKSRMHQVTVDNPKTVTTSTLFVRSGERRPMRSSSRPRTRGPSE